MDFLDIFPFTIKTIKTTVDHVGRTDREMTYVLSTRATLRLCVSWANENQSLTLMWI